MMKHTKPLLAAFTASALIAGSSSAGIVAYYDFEGDVLDGSGEGNNGTHASTATFSGDTAGAVSGTQSLVIGDPNNYVTVAHSSSLAFSGGQASFSLWLKSNSPGAWNKFMDKGNVFLAERRNNNADGRLLVNGGNAGNIGNLGNIVNGSWNHIVVTLDNGSFQSYLNGTAFHSGTYTGGLTTTDALVLGAGNTSGLDAFEGFLDEVAIYDQVLTQENVTALNAGADPTSIPEPGSLALLGLGGLLVARRRR